jgi:hypothetical protein
MTVRKRLASFHGWIELFQALDRLEAKIGSRERAEQKMYEYLRAPDGLPAKKWCQGGGVGRIIDIEPTHWSLPILQKARSKDGVDHGNLHCWYYVKLSRFEELCSAAFPNNTPSALGQTPRHAGGAPAEHDWNGAVKYVEDWINTNGPLPRDRKGDHKPFVVKLMRDWFPPPKPKKIRRWLNNNPPPWW